MGHCIEKILRERNVEILATAEDIKTETPANAKEAVCIDFTTPDAFRNNYRFLAEHHGAVVVGTTGWNDICQDVCDYFRKCGTTMIYASNFSVGVNVLYAAVNLLSERLAKTGGYMPYIIEMHHIHKLDAPSGTAKSLASIVESHIGGQTQIQSVRAGEIPGIHTVGFEGLNDRITISHEAFSRAGLAEGAVYAAFLTEKVTGVHEFSDLL